MSRKMKIQRRILSPENPNVPDHWLERGVSVTETAQEKCVGYGLEDETKYVACIVCIVIHTKYNNIVGCSVNMNVLYRQGRDCDVESFLGVAVRDSERAHTGKGIWDVSIEENEDPEKSLLKILQHACRNDENCHFHFSHFLVAVVDNQQDNSELDTTNEIVAAGCAFVYPKFSVRNSYPGMSNAARIIRGISQEESLAMWDKISFLDFVFPDYDYDNTWMLESILVAPHFRNKGIAVELINKLFELGRQSGARECLVVCAIGNVAAYRSYEKAGFENVGKGESDVALSAMGYPGFHLFRKKY